MSSSYTIKKGVSLYVYYLLNLELEEILLGKIFSWKVYGLYNDTTLALKCLSAVYNYIVVIVVNH